MQGRERGFEFRDTVRTLLERGHTQILVNCNLIYMDPAGYEALVNAYLTVRNHGGTIKTFNLTKRIGPGLMTIARLGQAFEPFDDEQTALASFRGDQSQRVH